MQGLLHPVTISRLKIPYQNSKSQQHQPRQSQYAPRDTTNIGTKICKKCTKTPVVVFINSLHTPKSRAHRWISGLIASRRENKLIPCECCGVRATPAKMARVEQHNKSLRQRLFLILTPKCGTRFRPEHSNSTVVATVVLIVVSAVTPPSKLGATVLRVTYCNAQCFPGHATRKVDGTPQLCAPRAMHACTKNVPAQSF